MKKVKRALTVFASILAVWYVAGERVPFWGAMAAAAVVAVIYGWMD